MRNIVGRTTSCLVASIVLVSALAAGCAGSPQQKEAKFLENGKRYLLKKDYTRAMLEFQNAVRLAPEDSEAYYQLGAAFLDNGNAGDALRNLKKATELNPAHVPAQVRLAELMAASGIKEVVEEGEQRMEAVLRSSPGNVEALDALALNEFELGKWQDAEKHPPGGLGKVPAKCEVFCRSRAVAPRKARFQGRRRGLRKSCERGAGVGGGFDRLGRTLCTGGPLERGRGAVSRRSQDQSAILPRTVWLGDRPDSAGPQGPGRGNLSNHRRRTRRSSIGMCTRSFSLPKVAGMQR